MRLGRREERDWERIREGNLEMQNVILVKIVLQITIGFLNHVYLF